MCLRVCGSLQDLCVNIELQYKPKAGVFSIDLTLKGHNWVHFAHIGYSVGLLFTLNSNFAIFKHEIVFN